MSNRREAPLRGPVSYVRRRTSALLTFVVLALACGCGGNAAASTNPTAAAPSPTVTTSVGPVLPSAIPGGATEYGPQMCVVLRQMGAMLKLTQQLGEDATLLDGTAIDADALRVLTALDALDHEIALLPEWSPATSTTLGLRATATLWRNAALSLPAAIKTQRLSEVTRTLEDLKAASDGNLVTLKTYTFTLVPKYGLLTKCAKP